MLEGDHEFRIVMDLPGVRGEDLEVNLEHQTLTVKATSALEVPEGFKSRRRERPTRASFHRVFRLGDGVNSDAIKAGLKDGVLEITLPKSEQSLPRRIEVN